MRTLCERLDRQLDVVDESQNLLGAVLSEALNDNKAQRGKIGASDG
jgi:hypothetical protein